MTPPWVHRAMQLRQVCAETKAVLPGILSQLPNFDTTTSSLHSLKDLPPLDPQACPNFTLPPDDPEAGRKGTRIRVYDGDSFEVALQLQPNTTVNTLTSASSPAQDADTDVDAKHTSPPPPAKPVAVLNLASEKHAGGGWQNGSLAQEEALCYRSSLYLSLHRTYYPLPSLSAIYSPSVLLIRSAMSVGHNILSPPTPPADLPVTSIISLAGLRRPFLTEDGNFTKQDREITKYKITLALRVAATQGHRKIVLGALGCGAFKNPPEEVAECFLEVLKDEEFQGGWWEDVVFAVLDNAKGNRGGKDGVGNFGIFYRALDGVVV